MKKIKVLAFVLVALTLFSCSASALSGFKNVAYMYSEKISGGLEYTEVYSKYDDDSPQHSYVFEYKPGEGTFPILTYGESVYNAETIKNLADFEGNRGLDIRGGVNADFFSLQTGVPLGAVISEGRLLSSCSENNAMGIKRDGSYILGTPGIKVTLSHEGYSYNIRNFNKYPTVYVEYLLSSEFYSSSTSQSPGTEILINFPEDSPRLGEAYQCRVLEVYKDAVNVEIPDGCLLLSINNKSPNFNNFISIEKDDIIRLEFECNPGWENVEYAFGGSDVIVKDSQITEGVVDVYHEKVRNPRTSVGVRADGTYVFYAVDGGDNPQSYGLTLNELAVTMKDLGCVYALNLDGGGSTTVCVKLGAFDAPEVVNIPSGGSERKVSNAVLFVNSLPATGVPGNVSVNLSHPYVLSGMGYVDVSLSVLDTGYHSMSADIDNITVCCDTAIGRIEGNRIWPDCDAGTYEINVKAKVGDAEISGKTILNVVDRIDLIDLESKKTEINRGGSFIIPTVGYYMSMPVAVSPSSVKLSFVDVDEEGNEIELPNTSEDPSVLAMCDAGSIDSNGVFHGASDGKNYSAKLKVQYGETSAYMDIKVGIAPTVIGTFEDGSDLSEVYRKDAAEYDYVDIGRRSDHAVRFMGSDFRYVWPRVLSKKCAYLEIWVYDKLNHDAFAEIKDYFGDTHYIRYEISEDYRDINGWIRLVAKIPEEISQTISVTSIYMTYYPVNVILDNFTINYGDEAVVFADVETSWAKEYINKTYNMEISDGNLIDGERYFYPDNNLTRAEFAKMFAAFLRLDTELYVDYELRFSDNDQIPEWAAPYIKAMLAEGYMSGKEKGGQIFFNASDKITREEVIYVFGTLIPDSFEYELSFNDNDNIAVWSRRNVEKVVSFGLITGYGDNTLLPKKNISRAEISSVFVRALEKGILSL
ncbi:MAG: hypothetical protein E7623_03620 [Ruminococcaceae bacterium]|nr:hypothetical protein [Oscillospiraceae bacterium]